MVIAGWVQQYRLHGVSLRPSGGTLTRAVELGEAPNKTVVVTTFSHEALEPVYGSPHPRYAFVGEPTSVSASTKNLATSDQPEFASRGCWLLIEVMGTHAVPPALEAAFSQDPGQNSNPVLLELRASLRLQARPLADLAVGAYAARLRDSVLELFIDGPAVWTREHRFTERSYSLEVLEPSNVDEETLAEVTPYIEAGLKAPTKEQRALQLASHWFLRGRVEPPNTLDRFAGMFLTLEALIIGLARSEPTPDDLKRLDALEEVAKQRGSDLVEYVALLRGRCASPGLTERFRRLALRLFPDELESRLSDAQVFEELNRLRNRLLHPSRDYRELSPQESERADQAAELAQRYLFAAFAQG